MPTITEQTADAIARLRLLLGDKRAFLVTAHPGLRESIEREDVAAACRAARFAVRISYDATLMPGDMRCAAVGFDLTAANNDAGAPLGGTMCVCGHPRTEHSPRGGVLGCNVEGCACGPGCIHEGYVNAASG